MQIASGVSFEHGSWQGSINGRNRTRLNCNVSPRRVNAGFHYCKSGVGNLSLVEMFGLYVVPMTAHMRSPCIFNKSC